MSFSMNIPSAEGVKTAAAAPAPAVKELDAAERQRRAASAQAVVSDAPMQTKAAPVRSGPRAWEKAGVSGHGAKQRLSLNIANALRAKLEYLEGVSGVTKSEIAANGMLAECLRVEHANGLLLGQEINQVREPVQDKKASSIEGTSRIVLMVPPEIFQRLQALKDMRLIAAMSELAIAGIEDECNLRLKKRGEL